MSNIYIQEPPTSGKVLLQTTVGDIDIELWSKETPKACRNFIQLCLETYYDGTTFHRVSKGFIAQGGDPNGDGTGGESIYGAPFKDEFHSRLRFVRRGLVAMANAGKDDNDSQFFFTMGPCPELQNKHTLFGKVTGNTLYNMLKLEDCHVDKDDRPIYPHKILSTKVLLNPFTDIVPRCIETSVVAVAEARPKEKTKNFCLLSFGEEAEEEEIEDDSVAQMFRGKSKSSHDLANDPKLSSVSASSLYDNESDNKDQSLENIRKKLKTHTGKEGRNADVTDEFLPPEELPKAIVAERDLVRKQIKELKQELRRSKKDVNPSTLNADDKAKTEKDDIGDSVNPMLVDFHEKCAQYKGKNETLIPKDKAERSKQALELLAKFEKKLKAVQDNPSDEKTEENEDLFGHTLRCNESVSVAKDANMPSEDRYDITDPRNPMNQRRRNRNKK